MFRTLAPSVICTVAITPACGGAHDTSAPGIVLELPFEDSCEHRAAVDLAPRVPASGISFDAGVEGRAARFDGSGAELKLRGLGDLCIQDALTLEFFVNAADWTNPYGAGSGLESMVSHSDIFTVAIDPHSCKLQARLTTAASESSLRLGGGTVRPGDWHHVALVYDGAGGEARLVLDGEVVDRASALGTVPVRSDLDLVIGTWFQKNQAFCGALDSIRVWNRVLSAESLRARAALLPGARTSSS